MHINSKKVPAFWEIGKIPGQWCESLKGAWRNWNNERRVKADAELSRRWFKKMEPALPPLREGKVALIVPMGAYRFNLKVTAMMGFGLRMAGWRTPVLLVSRKSDSLERSILEPFGFTEYIYWEDFYGKLNAEGEADKAVEKWMAGNLDLETVKNWTLGPSQLGRQVMSHMHRNYKHVDLDMNSPQVRTDLRNLAHYCACSVGRAEAIFQAVQPQLLQTVEANYSNHGPLIDVAVHRGIRVLQTVQVDREDALFFWRLTPESRRIHPYSVPPKTLERVAAEPWTEERERTIQTILADRYTDKSFYQRVCHLDSPSLTREELVKKFNLAPNKKIIVVFSHILWDANLLYGSCLFADYGRWFVATMKAAYANPNVNWLVKLHPGHVMIKRFEGDGPELSEIRHLQEKCGDLPPHVVLLPPDAGVNSRSLYQTTDCGITVQGTSGIEMPCYGKPVITGGTGRYANLGFTIDSATAEEYLQRLATIQDIEPLSEDMVKLAKQHAYAYMVKRPWEFSSFRASFTEDIKSSTFNSDPLARNLVPVAKTPEEVKKNGDLASWADWAENGTTPDFVNS